jgi:hypothetical protein
VAQLRSVVSREPGCPSPARPCGDMRSPFRSALRWERTPSPFVPRCRPAPRRPQPPTASTDPISSPNRSHTPS